ncbi:MAG TPA: YciI family protein [Roseiflexaceae bacterium]|nr:YciI family protein [Roseiflexaceae bacterium]
MRYLCLIYQDADRPADLSEQLRLICDERLAVDEELRARGQLVASAVLQPAAPATTVRARSGVLSLVDTPSARQTAPLVAIYLLDARDLNEAIRLAGRLPLGRLGCVEVCPLEDSCPE